MNKYECLTQQRFESGRYSIVPIRYEDRMLIMKWRNEQIYHLRQQKPLTEADQNNYFNTTIKELYEQKRPSQILFSYLEDNICIGYGGLVHINWIDRNAEISFIIDTALEQDNFSNHWSNYLSLIEQVAFDELFFHKLFTYAFDLRPHLYDTLERNNYIREAVLKEHCNIDGDFKDVIIHSKLSNKKLTYRKANASDMMDIYHWANEETTRKNSFNSNTIALEDHKKWYEEKLKSVHSQYYICQIEQRSVGLVRFDKSENGEVIIGILIDKNFRGKGLAPKCLKDCCKLYNATHESAISAYIKPENIASIATFKKAGFVLQEECEINNTKALKYLYGK